MSPAAFAFLMLTDTALQVAGEADVQSTLSISQDIDEVQNLIHRQVPNPNMAPRAGLEPATKRLTAAHSTVELPGNEYLGAST